ncbi:XRE family transcriptional regulator [Burkholderia cepacia]|uniref:XRE family transcriptional regulator n=1 Tax=Burkholderia cepacia TaxID=292 RepID=UPI000F56B742|nr:helix-turn-helix transcriptional regulator [Burkholderia cepacia]RQT68106.1 XRE family transcriptional regulator [Burkholderia cepacia]
MAHLYIVEADGSITPLDPTQIVKRTAHNNGSVDRLYADGRFEIVKSDGKIETFDPTPQSVKSATDLLRKLDSAIERAEEDKRQARQQQDKASSEFMLFLQRLHKATNTDSASSLYSWAEPHGFNKQTLYNMISNQRVPGLEMLRKFSRAANVSIDWLLGEDILWPQGKFAALVAEAALVGEARIKQGDAQTSGGSADVEHEFVYVPRYDVKVSAGSGHWHDNGENARFCMAFRRHWVENYLHATEEDLSVVRVHGDSMAPILQDGDNILVNHSVNRPQDGIYVIRIDGQVLVKQTQVLAGKKLRIVSVNPSYESYTIDLSEDNQTDFAIIGKVVWFGRQI